MKISEIITDKYKLRIPPTVYYDLLYDVLDVEEEQEPVLDKIRAEIVQMPTISFNANDIYKADVLAIIDKYKAESEPQESEEV